MEQAEILVVDDRPENLLAMKLLMKDLEAEVRAASSGKEALEMVLQHNYALVLLDVEMPGMDGFETARMIHLADNAAHTPIIFLTASSKELRHVLKGYQSGAVDYIFRPVEAEILRRKVSFFLTSFKQKQELKQMVCNLEVSKQLIEKQNEILTRLSIHDDLTGLYNRRQLNIMLEQEFHRSKRYEADLVLLMLDLDHFKKVNDIHGHKFGDFVLKKFSRRLIEESRASDQVFRFGGEEFIILLTQTDIEGGMKAGERIRKRCQTELYTKDSLSMQVTTSIGVASFQNSLEVPNDMIAKADKALYLAKREGRNRVVVSG